MGGEETAVSSIDGYMTWSGCQQVMLILES